MKLFAYFLILNSYILFCKVPGALGAYFALSIYTFFARVLTVAFATDLVWVWERLTQNECRSSRPTGSA